MIATVDQVTHSRIISRAPYGKCFCGGILARNYPHDFKLTQGFVYRFNCLACGYVFLKGGREGDFCA